MYFRKIIILKPLLYLALIFSSLQSFAEAPVGSVYLDGSKSDFALILAHGKGKHPQWKVVEPLRHGVHEQLGFHTLSLQMPVSDKYWSDYLYDFPKAYETLKQAIHFLKAEKGVSNIYLMGHSMGSRMASGFISKHASKPVKGLIIAGCRNNGDAELSCIDNLERVTIPVLDIWGDDNGKDVDSAYEREKYISNRYTQVAIEHANHKFDDKEEEFVSAVVAWLKLQNNSKE